MTRNVSAWTISICLLVLFRVAGAAGQRPAQPGPDVQYPIASDVSPPLISMSPPQPAEGVRPVSLRPLSKVGSIASIRSQTVDPVVQTMAASQLPPIPIQNFDGIPETANAPFTVLPPDTEGDVGPNHYVQWVNRRLAVYDKSGALLCGPVPGRTLWNGFGDAFCSVTDDGDPIVLYDRRADRWMMSQISFRDPRGPFYQCLAVSQTPDPTGPFYRYAFKVSDTKLNDYPKFGVWLDAYYMAINQFTCSFRWICNYAGQGAVAFERDKLLAGNPFARMIVFDLFTTDPNLGGMLPSDFDGPPPPEGSPNYFIEVDFPEGYPTDTDILQVFQFHADWLTPAASTFTGPLILETAPFNPNLCGFAPTCIPQLGSSQKLDALSDRLMYRLQYRNFGDYESLVMNHTVNVAPPGDNRAGIRWYELRRDVGDWSIFQQGTYAPDDGNNRWMGSVAQDRAGDITLGFSVSGDGTFPSIRYVGRLIDDPPGTLPAGEASLIEGAGVQLHSSGRWGDYSMMALDPSDDCTFWYTQEYYAATSSANWQTRIGSFAFPNCGGPTRVLSPLGRRPSVNDLPIVPSGRRAVPSEERRH